MNVKKLLILLELLSITSCDSPVLQEQSSSFRNSENGSRILQIGINIDCQSKNIINFGEKDILVKQLDNSSGDYSESTFAVFMVKSNSKKHILSKTVPSFYFYDENGIGLKGFYSCE